MEADPEGQLTSLSEEQPDAPVIIDEAQRSPKLALAIKKIVDRNRRKGQFVLTGSSNVFTTAEVADSLAGRMQTLKLWPLTTSEVNRLPVNRLIDWAVQGAPSLPQIVDPAPLGRKDYVDLILRGGYPEIRTVPVRARQRLTQELETPAKLVRFS